MPSQALRVGVVADDLSGAADTAVQFVRAGEEIVLVRLGGEVPAAPAGLGLAIDTQTRGCDPAEAVRRVETAAGILRRSRPDLVYHKIDSQLRGRPGLEIETLRRALGLRCALVAPAHPGHDRVTLGGMHLVRGVPAAEGEAGRDPVAPVRESRLPELLAQQAGVTVAHVHRGDLEGDPGSLGRKLEGLRGEGHRLISFDVTTPQHLDRIAEVATGRLAGALLAGSAGLATALASRLRPGDAARSEAPSCASMLLVCGSASRSLRRQVAFLLERRRCQRVTLSASGLAGEELRALGLVAADAWEACDLVVQAPEERLETATAPASILAALAELSLALVAQRRPDALFLCGGDTARTVLGAAGACCIGLRGEVVPGAPWGAVRGGVLDGVTVVTRSGAFGTDEDLLAVHRRCRRDGAI